MAKKDLSYLERRQQSQSERDAEDVVSEVEETKLDIETALHNNKKKRLSLNKRLNKLRGDFPLNLSEIAEIKDEIKALEAGTTLILEEKTLLGLD